MAGMRFEYDEEGGTFYYFLLSFVALILFPATYYLWPRQNSKGILFQTIAIGFWNNLSELYQVQMSIKCKYIGATSPICDAVYKITVEQFFANIRTRGTVKHVLN